MTDRKKAGKDKARAKTKKLQLSKETLKDLNARGAGAVKGGVMPRTYDEACKP